MGQAEKLRELFNEKNGILTFQELQSSGYSYYLIRKMIAEGIIERISRGKYVLHESVEDEYLLAQQIIPTGIVCLLSAAAIFNYTTFIPHSYHMAIKGNYHPSLPDYPPIKLYYWRKKQYIFGIKSINLNQSTLRIYDKEKTICDFLKFRNKLDVNVVKEVIKAYLADEERNLVKLKTYSKELKVESVLDNYLGILL